MDPHFYSLHMLLEIDPRSREWEIAKRALLRLELAAENNL